MLKTLRHTKKLKSALAAMLLAGFALALLMSASPELHRLLHHDANDDAHECLVTTLNHDGCDSDVPAPLLTKVHDIVFFSAVPVLHSQWVEPLFLMNCVLEHAPPVTG